tara:strand:- start:1722 stop:2900 length:1179 start_codon:yes stop_codon:yes gene_type:complete
VHGALKAAVEVVVVATKFSRVYLTLLTLGASCTISAKVLPEDRSDLLYHGYEGGGVTIQGPSVLIRKAYKDKVSVWGNYYVDMISGASIDVEATASKYSETREEFSVGADYLYDKTIIGVGYTQSEEDDYSASTIRLGISQDFFGDLTTLSMGYAYGDDIVRRNGDDVFEDEAQHQSFRLEISQILTTRFIMNLGIEAVTDEGYLNNPYRSVRFRDASSANGYSYQAENYPRTRNSDAVAVRGMYYLPYRAALRGEYRYYTDSWGIDAHNGEVSYTHPIGDHWEFDANLRYYDQTQADFYADVFAFQDAQNFLARDKELAAFNSTSIGAGASYSFGHEGFWVFSKGSANLYVDYVMFDYQNFSDVTAGAALGDEPLYQFDAVVVRAYLSLWF